MGIINIFKNLFAPRDMTEGTPWKHIALFAFPMIIGNFAQQLYNTVDAVVVGRSVWGYNALAAVGNAAPIFNLLLALFIGVATGAGILVSQFYGAKDRENLEKTIGNCIFLSAVSSVIIMVIGTVITGPLLKAVGTLPELYDQSRSYLVIMFLGMGGGFFYNMLSGVLRGLGDSFSALMFLFVCAGLNIVGDLLLVDDYGVAGVAIATVVSQGISAVLCFIKLFRLKDIVTFRWSLFKPDKNNIMSIIRIGVPSGITQAIFSCGMIVVQSLINSFNDAMFVACNVMVMRVDGYCMLPNFSFGQAMSTYTGQNAGAGKINRIKTGAKQGIWMSIITAVVLTPIILLGGPTLMRLFAPDNEELVKLSMNMMYILAAGYVAMSVIQPLQGIMRGAGDTMTPMWIGMFTSIVIRIPLAYIFVYVAKNMGAALRTQESMIFVSLLTCWMIGLIINSLAYKFGKWRRYIKDKE